MNTGTAIFVTIVFLIGVFVGTGYLINYAQQQTELNRELQAQIAELEQEVAAARAMQSDADRKAQNYQDQLKNALYERDRERDARLEAESRVKQLEEQVATLTQAYLIQQSAKEGTPPEIRYPEKADGQAISTQEKDLSDLPVKVQEAFPAPLLLALALLGALGAGGFNLLIQTHSRQARKVKIELTRQELDEFIRWRRDQ